MGTKFISSEQSIAAAGAALAWQDEDEQTQVVHATWLTALMVSLTLAMKRWIGV